MWFSRRENDRGGSGGNPSPRSETLWRTGDGSDDGDTGLTSGVAKKRKLQKTVDAMDGETASVEAFGKSGMKRVGKEREKEDFKRALLSSAGTWSRSASTPCNNGRRVAIHSLPGDGFDLMLVKSRICRFPFRFSHRSAVTSVKIFCAMRSNPLGPTKPPTAAGIALVLDRQFPSSV